MPKIPVNPLRWFKKKETAGSVPAQPTPSIKRPAVPKKSGSIFMHLINLRKNLQAVELAHRQGLDYKWLLQKARELVCALKGEAEAACDEDLAQGAGQILAYLDTVVEGRLDFDEDGLGLVIDFVLIFKEALGEAVPGIRSLDHAQLQDWNVRYQNLMARMKPIEQDVTSEEFSEPSRESKSQFESAALAAEPAAPIQEDPAPEIIEEETAVLEEDLAYSQPASPEAGPGEKVHHEVMAEAPTVDEAPPSLSDVVISDAETKSARELLESMAAVPDPGPVSSHERVREVDFMAAPERRNGNGPVKTPIQLEEVERLKKKLLQLHEKQEILSSKMSGILGDLKKTQEQKEQGAVSVEKLEIEELEDLIFIGRKKG